MSAIRMGPRGKVFVVCLSILATTIRASADENEKLLNLALNGHKAAQERIQSVSCSVVVETGFPTLAQTNRGKYWRSGEMARIQHDQPTGTADYYYLGSESEIREIIRNRPATGQPGWWAGRRLFSDVPHPLDISRHMFLEFDLLLPAAKGQPRVTREKVAGRDCLRISMDYRTETEVIFWLDVGRNYLVWKRVMVTKGDRSEIEILEFIEAKPGVFFPVKRGGKIFRGSDQIAQGQVTITDVRVNESIPKDVFQLPAVPRGTICNDRIKKLQYPMDENWQQIPGSRPDPWDYYPTPDRSSNIAGIIPKQSVSESRSWVRWIVPASLTVLVFACVGLAYRQYKSRTQGTGRIVE